MSPSLCIWVVGVHQRDSDQYKQDRKNCQERASVLFTSNLRELGDQELDTVKDFALQGGVTEGVCLSVQNCKSRHQLPLHPEETYDLLNLRSPAHLLLPLSPTGAANPARSLITKTREKRKFLVISFRLRTPAGQRCLPATPGEAPD